MKITEKTKIKSICCIQSDISVGEFLSYLLEEDDLSYGYEVDEIIDLLNEDDGIMEKPGYLSMDDWDFTNYDGLEFRYTTDDDLGILNVLEKVFKEEYLMLFSVCFFYPDINDDILSKTPFVEHDIISKEDEKNLIWDWITKGHYEFETTNITNENFLSDSDKEKIKEYDIDGEKRYYDAKNCWYFIKKAEYNKDEWWKGWTCQEA